ncbi:uncharacterized protein LOC107837237 isoform X1 [Poecilia formosa]|uniref:uncharacterized protein LOC107837237 isoform X1 n=2 Tax=Poecilia formosa TaxID=48698 RepID=UPI0007B9A4C5|nr:PREDICTED: uncharacterized protein LOC107837237 isoform X1 [Poecilia formosa]
MFSFVMLQICAWQQLMEFWLDNQGQSQMYSRFGTLPSRNCANNYHERRQATYNTLCYGEQQDQGRECSDWMVPGSRAGGALQGYTNWTDPEPPDYSSPNFPFILHRHEQRHQDLGEYRQHNPRDREWVPHGAARDYNRGFLRDAWPKRWDQTQPSRYNRDVSAKRTDSSYRELEAWAARYSHSLPRRRRLEAELREAVQGQSEREKLLTHPEVQLQCNQLNRSSRAHGLWDKAGRLCPTAHMEENTEYQSRVLDKPPGYIGPPPYNRPHKSPPVMHHCDFGRRLVGKKQADWSQPTLRKSDVLLDLETKRKVEKDASKICPGLEELEFSKHERDALQGVGSIDAQKPEGILDEEPQAVQKSDMEKEEICKVIEGRKFRLKKKTGGMTIFCLVSRIASPSETTSLPVYTSQTSVQITEMEELSKDRQVDNQVNKIADDVDFRPHTLTEQSDKKTPECKEKVMLKDDLPNNNVFLEKSGFVSQSVEPVLTRYPLWREPSSSTKAEAETFNTNSLKETKGSILNQDEGEDVRSQSTVFENKKLDIAENTEDMKGLLVIDTSCVVVKVEMIPSPKKEQVHYLDSTAHDEGRTSESNSQVYQDVATGPSSEALQRYEDPEADLDPILLKKQEDKESGNSPSGVQSPLVSERETLEERAERILGVPLHDDEQQTEDEEPTIDQCKEEQSEEAEPPDSGQTLEDTAEVLLVDKDDSRKLLTSEDDKDFTASQQPANTMAEDDNTESQLESYNTSTKNEMNKERGGEFTCGESENEEHLVDLSNTYSVSSDSSIQEGADSELDAQSADPSPHSDASPPLFPESPNSPLSSTLSEEQLPSPPPLEVLLEADVESGAEPKQGGEEMSDSAENRSLVTEMKEVLPHLHNHQCDNTFCVTEKEQTAENDSSRAEAKYEGLNISAQTEGATYANKDQDLQLDDSNFSDPTVRTGEDNEENPRTCKSEDYGFLPKYNFEDNVLCKTEKDGTLNPDLTASALKETSNERDEFTQTQLNNLQISQDECPDDTYPSSGEVLNKLLTSDISTSPQEPDGDNTPLSKTEITGCPLSFDITATPDIVGHPSNSFYLDSCEESSQLKTFLSQEEDVSPKFSPSSAQKRASQYPKSLLDVVSRIRKHTAPDSESEEEEVSEQWDPSCLDVVADTKSEKNFSDELQAVLKHSTETGQADQDDKDPEGHAEEDTMSCSSHVSEDTVTLGIEETTLPGEVKEEYDAVEQGPRCSSEEKDEIQLEESEEEDNVNICGSNEESPVEVDQEVSDVLS